jgi:isocitrate/isopropylmalate dehydrogenase
MLAWLGEESAAETLMEAVERVMASGIKTRDLGGPSRTADVTEAVCNEVERLGPKHAHNAAAFG